MNASTQTYQIPEWNVEDFQNRIELLNRKARKLGCVEVAVEIKGESFNTLKPRQRTDPFGFGFTEPERTIKLIEIDVTGEAPTLNGWTFIGTIQHDDGMNDGASNLLRAVPGYSIPEFYRTRPEHCDHCNQARNRKDTYILLHEDGTMKQIGKTCLKDFLGHKDPHAIAAFAAYISELFDDLGGFMDEDDAEYSGCPRGQEYWRVSEFLPWVVANVNACGWVSRTNAKESYREATADSAMLCWTTRDQRKLKDEFKPTEAHESTAISAITWIQSQPEAWASDDYKANMWHLFNERTFITYRDIGLAASLIPLYLRAIEHEIYTKKAIAESHHIGTVGKRDTFELTCTRINVTEPGQWGSTYIVGMVEGTGNQVVWFASKRPGIDATNADGSWVSFTELAIGDTVKLKATVKTQGEYNGYAQTIITRASILDIVPAVDAQAA